MIHACMDQNRSPPKHMCMYACQARLTCLLACPVYNIKEIILCMRQDEGLRCLQIIDTIRVTIESMFRLGFGVFRQDIKRDRRVGALFLNSRFIVSITCLKFLTESIDLSLVIDLKSSEQRAATSLRST